MSFIHKFYHETEHQTYEIMIYFQIYLHDKKENQDVYTIHDYGEMNDRHLLHTQESHEDHREFYLDFQRITYSHAELEKVQEKSVPTYQEACWNQKKKSQTQEFHSFSVLGEWYSYILRRVRK